MTQEILAHEDDNLLLRVHELVAAELTGASTPEQSAELEKLVIESPSARTCYLRLMVDDLNLREWAERSSGSALDNHSIDPEFLASYQKQQQARRSFKINTLLSIAAVLLFSTSLMLFFQFRSPSSSSSSDHGGHASAGTGVKMLPMVSLMANDRMDGPSILHQRMNLATGVASVQMGNRAAIYLEGPVQFTILDDETVDLHHGKLMGWVPEGVNGLKVVTEQGAVVDLGTEFGVSFYPKQPLQVHVFQGSVELQPKIDDVKQEVSRLVAGQSAAVQAGEVRDIAFDQVSYARMRQGHRYQLESQDAIAYWRFEELGALGGLSARGENDAAILHLVDEVHGVDDLKMAYHQVTQAEGVPGIGGVAAAFDGRQSAISIPSQPRFELDAVAAGQPALEREDRPISVSLWFKTEQKWLCPKDRIGGRSAILVTHATAGYASSDWSIQGVSSGRVRVIAGDNRAEIGTILLSQPGLDDNQWHHLVWTRQASGENKLYVDGQLVTTIHDQGGTIRNDQGIKIGRDPVHRSTVPFQGAIDEVAIFDQVLSASRIKRLYETGTRL